MTKTSSESAASLGRRQFLSRALLAGGAVGVCALGLGVLTRESRALPAHALRPPGALTEDDFLGACIRCGLCVRDCPYDTLRLAALGEETTVGTPYFVAREIPCEMCEDIPCVLACPTGALDPALTDIDRARMGVAVLVGHETCLNLLGLRCDVCYRVCPLIDEAITLERSRNIRTHLHAMFVPTVHTDICTGCGKCEKSCVLPEAAIKVLPPALARGKLGEHYRLGWEEKRKAGKALVDDIIDLPDRGYQGEVPLPGLPERLPGGGFKEFKP